MFNQSRASRIFFRPAVLIPFFFSLIFMMAECHLLAAILWSDLGATLAHQTGTGADILGGLVRRDDTSSDTLYFKFHVDPLSDVGTEEYLAALELFEKNSERLAVGNSLKAWAYSAFNTSETGTNNAVFGDVDLHSARPEPSAPGVFLPYELPRRGSENTFVFKVQYVPGSDDLVTIWLNPNLASGATEESQPTNLVTHFKANASFTEIHLRHSGGGGGWTFSDMSIATSFQDFVAISSDLVSSNTKMDRTELPLVFKSWQREEGLPQNSVRALAQTSDGYLWIGSNEGLSRFDGIRFVPLANSENTVSSAINTLCADKTGALWIGTAGGGLTCWRNEKKITLTKKEGLPSDTILSLAEETPGRIWIGTDSGLAIWQDGHLAVPPQFKNFNGRPITALFKDRNETIWIGVKDAGVFHLTNGKWIALSGEPVANLLLDPHCLLVDRFGKIWIGAGDDFVVCRDENEWHRYRIPRHLEHPFVTAFAEEPDGTVWAASVSEGLFQFKNGKLSAVNASSGMSDNFVQALLADREGNLWVGTSGGLNEIRRGNLWVLGKNKGLGYGAIRGLAELASGAILVAKPNGGLYAWTGNNFSHIATAGAIPSSFQITTLLPDGNFCWIGSAGGLWHFDGAQLLATTLKNKPVISLATNGRDEIFAGTRDGELWKNHSGNWNLESHFPRAITAIAADKNETIWIGTDGAGLHELRNGSARQFTKTDGLPSDSIRTLHIGSSGAIWIGTSAGLSRWNGQNFARFTTAEGLPDNSISQILEDDFSRLWLGSNRGIVSVTKQNLQEVASGKATLLYPQIYGRAEGMASEECASGFFPSAMKTKSGLLLFPTLKGIVAISPRSRDIPGAPLKTTVEDLLVDGNAVANLPERTSNHLQIQPGRHRVEFHYTALSFIAPEQIRFRYRLQGLDADWLEAGNRRSAFYSYVPPGNYTFQVTACNADGTWNAQPAEIKFTVLPFFWQSRWFIGIASLALMILVAAAVRVFEKRKAQRRLKILEQERALQRERARIAADLHDDLGSSLARISLLSGLVTADKNHSRQVEAHAQQLSQSADETMRALEEIVWAIRPGSDSLQSLIEYIAHFANELFANAPARCRLDLPHDLPNRTLPPEVRHNLFLIIKEALTNVLKHSGATEVRVAAKTSDHFMIFSVQDNGKGFPIDKGKRIGNGLGNMQNRAEAIGAKLTTISAPCEGTSVRVEIDLSQFEPAGSEPVEDTSDIGKA
jgi:signal transduction histidine kinase/ligand-binding sensor domain-containing protein